MRKWNFYLAPLAGKLVHKVEVVKFRSEFPPSEALNLIPKHLPRLLLLLIIHSREVCAREMRSNKSEEA
jgi:hypothetical protein